MMTTHLHLPLQLRMSGAKPLLPLHAFMAWNGATLPLPWSLQWTSICVGLLCASNHNTKTGQATYIQHNTDAGSCNHCFCGKPVSITHSDCVSAALVTQQAMHMPHIVCHLWPAQLYNIFPHYLINGKGFRKKVKEHEMNVLIFFTTFVRNISHSKKNWARYD